MDTGKTPKELISFLLDPDSYLEKPINVAHIETHISHVFVCDTFVYKIKKPVNFSFLNFSSLRKRQYFCNKEVILNTRLAKDIYLNVVPIYGADGHYSFIEDKNRPVEYAVRMKKIPMDCLLFNLIAEGRPLYGELEEVGRTLALFHGNIEPYRGKKFGGIETILATTEENFEQIKPFCGVTLDQKVYETIMSYTRNFFEQNKSLFGIRKGHGFIRDGHGDLHCQHICLEHPPVIFDCIEFNDSFRVIDILQDIAFLFMDLEYRGRFDLTSCLFKSYFSHQRSALHEDLLRFYKVYRAVVRGKVEGLTAGSVGEAREQGLATARARNYFDLADYYIRYAHRPFNPVVFMGLSGSGKSTIAREFAPDAVILRSDEIRKEATGVKKDEHHYRAVGEGIYTSELTRKIYCALLENAVNNAREGRKVIVDATYLKEHQRRDFYDSCIGKGLNPFFVHCYASEEVLKDRIRKRMKEGRDISDAHLGILEHQLKHLEEPDELPGFRVLRINTEDAIDRIVNTLKEFL
jgi:aminoglycoside phosphotransferase family enzyme/predicted kinase